MLYLILSSHNVKWLWNIMVLWLSSYIWLYKALSNVYTYTDLISYNQNSITLPTRKTASLWTSTPGHPHKTPLTPPSQHPTNQVINWPLDNSFTFIRRIASLTAVKTKAHGPEHMAFADYANEPHPANCSQERVVTPDACVFFTYFF